MKKQLKIIRREYTIFHRLTFVGVIYYLLLRRRTWFKLTGNPIFRFSFILFSFSSMMDAGFTESDYLYNQVVSHNLDFEKVIWKYNESPKLSGRVELLTSWYSINQLTLLTPMSSSIYFYVIYQPTHKPSDPRTTRFRKE